MNLKPKSFKDVLIHLGLIAGILIILVVAFFYVYLPATTNHGETITMPDVRGKHEDELGPFLSVRNLRYEIRSDSGYSETEPPLSALNQHPLPGSKVKENRKIYITLNARKPPLVPMPNLISRKVANAEKALKDVGLVRGEIIYEPDIAENAVLRQMYKGEEIPAGNPTPRGSKIDLVVGDGLGKQTFTMPDLTGMEYEDAKVYVTGVKMKIGSVINDSGAPEEFTGIVTKQHPVAGSQTRSGQLVDLWVGRLDEAGNQEEGVTIDDLN